MLFLSLQPHLKQLRVHLALKRIDPCLSIHLDQQGIISVPGSNLHWKLDRYIRLQPDTLNYLQVRQIDEQLIQISFVISITLDDDHQLFSSPVPDRMPVNQELLNDWLFCCGHNLESHMANVQQSCSLEQSLFENKDQLLFYLQHQPLHSKLLLEHPDGQSYIRLLLLNSKCIVAFDENHYQKEILEDKSQDFVVFHSSCMVCFDHIRLSEHPQRVRECRTSFEYELLKLTKELFEMTLSDLLQMAKRSVHEAHPIALQMASYENRNQTDPNVFSYLVHRP